MAYTPSESNYNDTGTFFEPDTLLPAQYYATVQKGHQQAPERRLMVAVLEDVVACLSVNPNTCSRRQRLEFHSAHSWVNAPIQGEWVFSFHHICDTLGFDTGFLRRGLNQWAKRYGKARIERGSKRKVARKPLRLRALF
ncbi:MAG: hypothetical protein FJ145_26240 [Deltaproteobacteria bacterium]|nr:hypothetical protein [Deltaproteobacteria bacterium]